MMDQRYTHIFAILQQEIEKPDSTEWYYLEGAPVYPTGKELMEYRM